MKLSELRERENIDQILESSIRDAIETDRLIDGMEPGTKEVQLFEHPFFSVLVPRHFCKEGREYLCRQYSHSPQKKWQFFQLPAVSLMSQKHIFDSMLRPSVHLGNAAEDEHQMWMPGNHRIRKFDFARRIIRVYPKTGFSTEGMEKEIEIRQKYASQFAWILPLTVHSQTNACFDEPLLETVPINRLSKPSHQTKATTQASDALKALHQLHRESISSQSYIDIKHSQYAAAKERIHRHFPGLCFDNIEKILKKAADYILQIPSITLSMTHGDFQPGNVLVSQDSDEKIWIIDWEDAGIRASIYDPMTWILKSRAPQGIGQRILDFQCSPKATPFELPMEPKTAVALWVIEEWIWLFESSSRSGIEKLPMGISQHFMEIASPEFQNRFIAG